MKRLFFYIMCMVLQLLGCNHLFANADIQDSKLDWLENLSGYLPDSQTLPYVLPIAAVGAQALALPELARRGYVSPEAARMASLATGIVVPAAANWLQYQRNKAQPELINVNYFAPSAIMAALNWIALGRNITDIPNIVLQYLYALPASVLAAVLEGTQAQSKLKNLMNSYNQKHTLYTDKLKTLSAMISQVISNPTLQLDLKEYIDTITQYNDLAELRKTIQEISSDVTQQLEAPWMSILKPIIGELILKNEKTDQEWLKYVVNHRDIEGMLMIIYRAIDGKQEIKNILTRGNISELDNYLNHYISLLLNAGLQVGWSHYVVNDQVALFIQSLMTYMSKS